MTLSEFRQSRRVLTIAQAQAEFAHLADLDLSEYSNALIYANGTWILQSAKAYWLLIESDEWESPDLAVLEFILYEWQSESLDHITNQESALSFLRDLHASGLLFHPDESARDCLSLHRLPDSALAAIDSGMARAREFLPDICQAALDILNCEAP